MAASEPPESSTLIIAALLILALAFAGSWIVAYVQPGGDPWRLLPWFGSAAAVILVVGLIVVLVRRTNAP
jgi:hypothetical protein